MAAEAEFLLLLYSHPASTALPPGKGNLDQLPGEFPPSLSPDWHGLGMWSNDPTTAQAGVTRAQQARGSAC